MNTLKIERFIPLKFAKFISDEIDMAGINTSVNNILVYGIAGGLATFAAIFLFFFVISHFNLGLVLGLSILGMVMFNVFIYVFVEYKIDKRKTFLESFFPDFLQIVSANLRSGISLDRAMLMSLRPEFKYFNDDINNLSRKIYAGETFENGLKEVSERYRSNQLKQSVRMIIEALKYGGATADLLEQISKDLRSQQLVQKEISGQLYMYSIFVAFAGLVAAPALFGLTGQMIGMITKIWGGILQSNPQGFGSVGLSLLRPSPPKITPTEYYYFSLAVIIIVTGFASMIMSAISSGSIVKGFKYTPVFILVGLGIYFVVSHVIIGIFSGIGAA
jgi:hypothetical protein